MLHYVYVACVYVRKVEARRQELGKFFIEIMSNLNLFVVGSIHQGSERFYSDFSRGRQCSFMSFSALLFAQTLAWPIQQLTASNVDQILVEGDRLFYLDAFESRSIPDTKTLSLNYLSREMRWSLDANTMQIYTRQTNDSLQCRRLQLLLKDEQS